MTVSLIDHAPATARVRAAWAAAHAPVPGVPRWARTAAFVVPFTVLPSSVWRIAACTFHAPITPDSVKVAGTSSGIPGLSLAVYVVLLSIVSELLAFTAVGLVARWGEVFPRWVPVLRGRRVPILGAVVPAAAGATVLTLLWTWVAITGVLGRRVDGSIATSQKVVEFGDWQGWLVVVAYSPLILWGPLLAALTVAYWKRRRSSDLPIAGVDHSGARFRSPSTMAG